MELSLTSGKELL